MVDTPQRRRMRVPVRQDLKDAFWREIAARNEAVRIAAAPTLGTVVGREIEGRGKVRVLVDGEAESRLLGVVRSKGVAFLHGDRVWIEKNQSGTEVVSFPIAMGSHAAAEQAVGADQIFDDAIEGRKIRSNQITGGVGGHLAEDSVTRREILRREVLNDHLEDNQVDTRVLDTRAGNQAVTNETMRTDAVDSRVLSSAAGNQAVSNATMQGDAVDGRVLKANQVGKSHLTTELSNVIDDKATKTYVDNAVAGATTKAYVDGKIASTESWVSNNFATTGALSTTRAEVAHQTRRLNRIDAHLGINSKDK